MLIFSDINDETKKYIFIHIARCSGKYIRKQIYNRFKTYFVSPDIVSYPEIINPVSSTSETDNQYIMHQTYLKYKSYNLGQTKFITFVRNPYDRLISAYYYYLLSLYYDDLSNKNDILEFITSPFQSLKIKTMDEFIQKFKADFKKYVKTEVENLNEDFNYILTPQYKYIVDENNQIPEDITIYKLEEYTTESEAGVFFQFENFTLEVYDHSEYFDDETLEIVNRKYSKDFELLGYEKIQTI
jgi:hypothetical protein